MNSLIGNEINQNEKKDQDFIQNINNQFEFSAQTDAKNEQIQ